MQSFIKKYLKKGLISPGYNKLSFSIGSRRYKADLLADGTIFDENRERYEDVTDWVRKCVLFNIFSLMLLYLILDIY